MLEERCRPRPETRSRAALRSAFRVWRSQSLEKVRIWFAPSVAGEIAERTWIPGGAVGPAAGGGVVLSAEVAGLAEIERWVLSYGPAARVLSPRALLLAVRARLHDAARRYESEDASLSLADNDRS
jgi:predicted DNA-binding transcriptional regulator YafY